MSCWYFCHRKLMALFVLLCSLLPLLLGVAAGAPPFELELFPADFAKARGAQCLDHSPAGYYIREQDPEKWVVFLEGGGLCVELIDCLTRRSSSQGSSKHFDPANLPEGPSATSTSPLNPFQRYSHIYVPYCSGDTWLGGSSKGHIALAGMQMSGHLIIKALVERLLNTTKFGSATDVVLAGSSAGGIGVYHHMDWLSDTMASFALARNRAATRVTGFAIEGIFFPEKWPVLYEQFILGNRHPVANFMSQYLALLQEPWFSPACVDASKKQGFAKGDCFDVSRMIHYTKTPVFTAMNRFDALLIQDLGLCFTCKGSDSPTGWNGKFIRFYGALMNETVFDLSQKISNSGWFIPSEFHHDENFYSFLESKQRSIGGTSLRAAYEAWYSGRKTMLVEATCNNDGPCVQPSNCAHLSGVYFDSNLRKKVTVTQNACDLEVNVGGESFAGNVLDQTVTVATFHTRGAIQRNGDVEFVDGTLWSRQNDRFVASLVV